MKGLVRAAVVLCLANSLVAEEIGQPRAISDAERAAVEAAADFLARGPAAIWDRLGVNSPLRQAGQQAALEEIEVRTGPKDGAVWELQSVVPSLKDKVAVFSIAYPSGVDDTLIFELAPEAGTFKVSNLRILAEPAPGVAKRVEAATAQPVKTPFDPKPTLLMLGVLGCAAAVASAFLRSRKPSLAKVLVAGAGALVLAGVGLAAIYDPRLQQRPEEKKVISEDDAQGVRLASLLPLRRALASGDQLPTQGPRRDVATLWKAQIDLQQMKIDEVSKALAEFPSPSNIPLAEILRARLAFLQSREVDAVLAYERAIDLGPGRDELWYEAAQAFSILGFEENAKKYFRRLNRMGSREAYVYYTLGMIEALDNKAERAEGFIQKAWGMQPVERSELIGTAVLWEVIRRPAVASIVKVSSATEPTFAAPSVSSRAAQFPQGSMTRVSGDFLHVEIGEQELLVAGGASLAPVGTPTVNATEWTRTEESKAFAQLPHLLRSAQSPGAFTQPVLRRKIERAANALANHNRWSELLQLTDSLSPRAETIPTELFFLRGTALQRAKRMSDARKLFAELAVNRAISRKNDAVTMIELGELLGSVELYDAAIKLMERAGRIREIPYLDDRIRQISMNQRLATGYSLLKTANFDIRHPHDTPQTQAAKIGEVLEKELQRLESFIPVQSFERVTVNIVPWEEFRGTYTGSDYILGFYNGKITLPFANVPIFIPEIVAILTHELAHAMLAQATNDQAPRWFHEGIAQRVQMTRYAANAFNMYEDDKLFSLAVLDAVMRESPDPEMMQEAYIESQTIIRYIESQYGWKGVASLIAAFRDGATTEEATNRLWKQSMAAFDTQLRSWGRAGARVFENPDPVRYDNSNEGVIEFTRPRQKSDAGTQQRLGSASRGNQR